MWNQCILKTSYDTWGILSGFALVQLSPSSHLRKPVHSVSSQHSKTDVFDRILSVELDKRQCQCQTRTNGVVRVAYTRRVNDSHCRVAVNVVGWSS